MFLIVFATLFAASLLMAVVGGATFVSVAFSPVPSAQEDSIATADEAQRTVEPCPALTRSHIEVVPHGRSAAL